MNPFQIIKKIQKIESINLNNPEYVENYFRSQSPFMKNEITKYYIQKSCGQIPDICKEIYIQKEYPMHINPKFQAYENYIILESIKNDSVCTYNYNRLPPEQKDEINSIYVDILMKSITINISKDFKEKMNDIKIEHELKQTAMLSLN
ncbi:MAG: hypothetical protein K0B07_04720 [DPANN group archaeon]|nr:hypothetical protein [DPANN group archaeon]